MLCWLPLAWASSCLALLELLVLLLQAQRLLARVRPPLQGASLLQRPLARLPRLARALLQEAPLLQLLQG